MGELEKGLLLDNEEVKGVIKWSGIKEEVKRLSVIGGPLVAVNMSQYMLQVIAMMMVGHLGKLFLSSSALVFCLAGATGFSVLVKFCVGRNGTSTSMINYTTIRSTSGLLNDGLRQGMASALETTSGQAYGAKQYMKIGTQTYTAIFSLTLVAIPISILWINMEKVLVFIGQDPSISHEAGRFSTFLVPTIFAYAFLQPLVRYFQVQSLVMPLVISSCMTLCLHIPLCWVLVFNLGLQNLGAAMAMSISYWVNVILLILYMKFSPSCAPTNSALSMDIFRGVGEFFWFGIPSATMICLEWWSYELLILLSGLLPHPELETSVLSVCLTVVAALYAIPFGVGSAASTRVSNELGAGNPNQARTAAYAVMAIATAVGLFVSSILFATRRVFGFTFSNEKEVVDYVCTMAPWVCLSVIMNGLHGVLSGIARGSGWQDIGAFVNLAAYYLFGIPIAAILGFWLKLRGRGIWIGILCGSVVQTLLLSVIMCSTNWEKQANKARERLLKSNTKVGDREKVDEHTRLS